MYKAKDGKRRLLATAAAVFALVVPSLAVSSVSQAHVSHPLYPPAAHGQMLAKLNAAQTRRAASPVLAAGI
jgi:hypothetical protein